MKLHSKVGVCACSNGLRPSFREKLPRLDGALREVGLVPVYSDCLFENEAGSHGAGRERAEALMALYRDDEVEAIFDLSGGDMANEVLPHLDFDRIAGSGKTFWGYSDLSTVINAIYSRTGKASVLYQIRNLILDDAPRQKENFRRSVLGGGEDLFAFDYRFVQGDALEGVVVGGNLRCLLKLAGTPFWPPMRDKVLLLESRGGRIPRMIACLSQYEQLGVFGEIRGVLLGTFTEMEREGCEPDMVSLVRRFAGKDLPIVKTSQIGHGADSKAIRIGERIRLRRS